ncbi:hypothetical protein ElyMa_005267300 [Elysia marginata]|uniref:Uncharacterized protein n=1 Tax=Elysia marginata TaxID=1093978 RepID=A0AAV4JZH7_9GAST|nr:hypothetical protein ElyMa_005267300 [Elysia marginata]
MLTTTSTRCEPCCVARLYSMKIAALTSTTVTGRIVATPVDPMTDVIITHSQHRKKLTLLTLCQRQTQLRKTNFGAQKGLNLCYPIEVVVILELIAVLLEVEIEVVIVVFKVLIVVMVAAVVVVVVVVVVTGVVVLVVVFVVVVILEV